MEIKISRSAARLAFAGLLFISLIITVFFWWGGSASYFPDYFRSYRFYFEPVSEAPGRIVECKAYRAGSGFGQLRFARIAYTFSASSDTQGSSLSGTSYSSAKCPTSGQSVRVEYLVASPIVSRIRGARATRWGHGLNLAMLALVFFSGLFFLRSLYGFFRR